MKWKQVKRRIRAPFITAAVAVLPALLCMIPRSWHASIANTLGWLFSQLPATRKVIAANIRTAFPDWSSDQVAAVCTQCCRHSVRTFLEFLWFSRRPERLRKHIRLEGQTVHELVENGRQGIPMMLMAPHLGNWEVCAQALSAHGVQINAVSASYRHPPLGRRINALRTKMGVHVIPREGAVRKMIKALKNGQSVGILIDQNTKPAKGGVFVDFFGLPVPTTRAPATISRKLDLKVYCCACVRENGGLTIRARQLEQSCAEYEDDVSLTQDMLRLNETFIGERPEQYMWYYKRWQFIPRTASEAVRRRFPWYARLYPPQPEATEDAVTNAEPTGSATHVRHQESG